MRDFDYIAELVNRVRQEDLLAMKVLYNEFAREMLTASHRITQSMPDAEDIIQESFMTSFEKIHKLKEPKNYGAWLKRIVINNSLVLIKKQVQFEEVSSISEASEETGRGAADILTASESLASPSNSTDNLFSRVFPACGS